MYAIAHSLAWAMAFLLGIQVIKLLQFLFKEIAISKVQRSLLFAN
jgi:hypothetical protein